MVHSLSRDALAVLSGLLLILSFPKFGHGVVAWVALAPLLLALRGAGPRQAIRRGYVTGAVSSLGLVYWTSSVVAQYGGLSLPIGVLVMVTLCLALALFPALFAWIVARWFGALGPPALLLAPFAWVATEILRAHTLYRFAWCLLGYSQYRNLPFLQIASWTAVYGISFLVAGASSVLAYAATEGRAAKRWKAVGVFVVLMLAVWGQGTWVLSRPLEEKGRIRVGLVQANILQEEKWRPENALNNIERHITLTRLASTRGARLVVWPESAVPYYYDHTPEIATTLKDLAAAHQLHLVFGNDDREIQENGRDRVFVGAKMVTPDGRLGLRYRKMRLVPFGEYVPLQPLLTLGGRYSAKLVDQVADFTPGTEPRVADVAEARIGTFICYEAIFPDLIRQFAASGANLLVNITNDAWYGRTSAPYQHFSMAVLRAVENRRYLLRTANTGITAVVDPYGRALEQTRLFEPDVLVRDVPIVVGETLYTRYGDVFGWGCLGAVAALTAATRRRRR